LYKVLSKAKNRVRSDNFEFFEKHINIFTYLLQPITTAEGGHSSNRLEKVGECNLLMEKVSEAFFHVLIECHLCL
jgi:hypothetical protein